MGVFKPLTKKQTRELEENSTSYVMFLTAAQHNGDYVRRLHNWYQDDMTISRLGLYKAADYIAKRLGMKQTYYVQHTMRNAVRGFSFNDNEYLIYYSVNGLALQCATGTDSDEVELVVRKIIGCWTIEPVKEWLLSGEEK